MKIMFSFRNDRELERYLEFREDGRPRLYKVYKDGVKGTLLLGHGKQKEYAFNQKAFEKADWVVSCYPCYLTKGQRSKHVYPFWDDVMQASLIGNNLFVYLGENREIKKVPALVRPVARPNS